MSVTTPYFRVSFPNVFRAKKNELSGKDEFSIVALFPKGADLSGLKKAAQDAIEKKWGTDKTKWPQNMRSPFRDHSEKMKDGKYPAGHEDGGVFINLKSSVRPGIVGPDMQEIIDESQFYAGCMARASVNAYAYDNKGNRGVSFGLNHLQKVGDGEPFGTRSRVEDAFAPVAGVAGSAKTASSLFD
jgi:hypothetical protein